MHRFLVVSFLVAQFLVPLAPAHAQETPAAAVTGELVRQATGTPPNLQADLQPPREVVRTAATAPATLPPDTEDFPVQAFLALFTAYLGGGEWVALAVLLGVGLIFLVRTFGARFFPVLATDKGGAWLAILVGVGQALLTGMLAGEQVSLGLVLKAIAAALGSIGLYVAPKKIRAQAEPVCSPQEVINGSCPR